MKSFLDASVLVPVVTDQLANHPVAFAHLYTYNHRHFQGLDPVMQILPP